MGTMNDLWRSGGRVVVLLLLVSIILLPVDSFLISSTKTSSAVAVAAARGGATPPLQSKDNNDSSDDPHLPREFTGVRFSLYPNVAAAPGDNQESLKQVVKTAVQGLTDLGLTVLPDDVSSVLIGPESTLFEALRIAFGRAAIRSDGNGPRHLSMQCTFSAGCPGEDIYQMTTIPLRTVNVSDTTTKDDKGYLPEAYQQPPRIVAQFAIYPLGVDHQYMDIIYKVIDHAKESSVWKHNAGKTHFCSMLDGDGNQVFDVLQSSFDLAQEQGAGHVVMTATLTANKNAWPDADKIPSSNPPPSSSSSS